MTATAGKVISGINNDGSWIDSPGIGIFMHSMLRLRWPGDATISL